MFVAYPEPPNLKGISSALSADDVTLLQQAALMLQGANPFVQQAHQPVQRDAATLATSPELPKDQLFFSGEVLGAFQNY